MIERPISGLNVCQPITDVCWDKNLHMIPAIWTYSRDQDGAGQKWGPEPKCGAGVEGAMSGRSRPKLPGQDSQLQSLRYVTDRNLAAASPM